jgi:hypothetical protein
VLEEKEEEEQTTEDELRRVQLRKMEDNAMVVCAATLSRARFIAVDPSFKVLRSGKKKARHSRDLRALQGRGGQGTTPLWSARDGLELPGTVVPETRQIEGLAAEALSGSQAGVSVRTPAGLPELTSTCPGTHAGWVDG